MRNKCYLPASMEEIQSLPQEKLEFYWKIFYPNIPRNKRAMIRPLWYAIQCERLNLKLEDKYITRLNRYANNPEKYIQKANKNKYNLTEGTEIIKIYKEKEYKVLVKGPDAFEYNGQIYRTLSGIAKTISGMHVGGPDFFGLSTSVTIKN